MYVCLCSAVTDREIRQCAELGARSLEDVREALGVAIGCGKCEQVARALISEARGTAADALTPA
jgi:bacterioferritin-associated ferredoxin